MGKRGRERRGNVPHENAICCDERMRSAITDASEANVAFTAGLQHGDLHA